jgi:hypothetical protein
MEDGSILYDGKLAMDEGEPLGRGTSITYPDGEGGFGTLGSGSSPGHAGGHRSAPATIHGRGSQKPSLARKAGGEPGGKRARGLGETGRQAVEHLDFVGYWEVKTSKSLVQCKRSYADRALHRWSNKFLVSNEAVSQAISWEPSGPER